jgi:hypothetical protein
VLQGLMAVTDMLFFFELLGGMVWLTVGWCLELDLGVWLILGWLLQKLWGMTVGLLGKGWFILFVGLLLLGFEEGVQALQWTLGTGPFMWVFWLWLRRQFKRWTDMMRWRDQLVRYCYFEVEIEIVLFTSVHLRLTHPLSSFPTK